MKIPLFQTRVLGLSGLSPRLAAALARRGLAATVTLARVDGEPASEDDEGNARGEGAAFDAAHAIGDALERAAGGIERLSDYRDAVKAALRAGEADNGE